MNEAILKSKFKIIQNILYYENNDMTDAGFSIDLSRMDITAEDIAFIESHTKSKLLYINDRYLMFRYVQ